jgi:hypothetical protein
MRTQAFARKTNGSFNQLTKVKAARGGETDKIYLGSKLFTPSYPSRYWYLFFITFYGNQIGLKLTGPVYLVKGEVPGCARLQRSGNTQSSPVLHSVARRRNCAGGNWPDGHLWSTACLVYDCKVLENSQQTLRVHCFWNALQDTLFRWALLDPGCTYVATKRIVCVIWPGRAGAQLVVFIDTPCISGYDLSTWYFSMFSSLIGSHVHNIPQSVVLCHLCGLPRGISTLSHVD